MTRLQKRTVFAAAALVLTFAVLEMVFFVGGRLLQSKWAMWRVPRPPAGARENLTFEQYMSYRDPVLGWPYPRERGVNLAANGAWPNPYFDADSSDQSCVSLYGDSFTEGGDVSAPEKTWANVLSKRLDCYVMNFGVGGYGTDQAYLRFEGNESDRAPVVIFGLHPGDALRNLTRIRDLENYAMWFALKPRFILTRGGELELVPIPVISGEEYRRIMTLEGDQLVLEHENLHPGGPAGIVKLEFPFTLSVLRNLASFHGFRSRLFRYPDWMEFLQPGHPLFGLEIMVGISEKFVTLAGDRGKQPLIVVLPHPKDFAYFEKTGEWPYQHVLREFERLGLPFVDFGPRLLSRARASGTPLRAYFGPTEHYNDAGNALLAEFMAETLSGLGMR